MPHWLTLHWVDVVPAWLAVIVAAVFGILAVKYSRRAEAAQRAAKGQADLATEKAKEAVRAQEAIAAETRRLADVAEREWDAAERRPWDIKPDGGSGCYRLINKRDTPKYDIYLSGDRIYPNRPSHFRFIDGGDSKSIYLQDSGVVNRTVRVRWRPTEDHSGEPWPQDLEP